MENLKVNFENLKGDYKLENLSPETVDYNINICIAEALLQEGNIFYLSEEYGLGGDPDCKNAYMNAGFKFEEDCDPNVIIPAGTLLKVTKSYFYQNGSMDFGGCNVSIIGYSRLLDFDFEIWGYCENYSLEDFCELLNLNLEDIYAQLKSAI